MPGLSLFIGSALNEPKLSAALADFHRDYSAPPEIMFRDDHTMMAFSGHEGYPRHYFEDDDRVIFLEGVVYNRPVRETCERLRLISDRLVREGDARSLVREFVDSSDGDFLCAIYSKRTPSLLIFADRYGRLHSFYHTGADFFALSREVKFLLHWLPEVAIDRLGLAQYLMFGYTLGDRTLFQAVRRLIASHAVLSRVDVPSESVDVSIDQVLALDFDEIERPPSRTQCVDQLTELCMQSVEDRYTRCLELGLPNIVDVSGGYDTRTVVGGMERIGAEVEYFTHKLVTGDESEVALQVGGLYGKQVRVISASHERDRGEYEELVYATDGLVNGWTALTSWRDVHQKRQAIGSTAACHMGLGGGFIRHPLVRAWGHRTLISMLRANLLRTSLSSDWVGYLTGLDSEHLLSRCGDYFGTYSEQTIAGQLKHFNDEYLVTRVAAGEDRARRLFWTVQPLWAKDWYAFVANAMPVKYADVSFHSDLLRSLDARLLTVPIYGSSVRLDSRMSVRLHDVRSKLKNQLRALVRYNRMTNRLNFQRKARQSDRVNLQAISQHITHTHEALDRLKNCIARPRIDAFLKHGYGMTNYDRLLTILVYFRQLEDRFGDKIQPEGSPD